MRFVPDAWTLGKESFIWGGVHYLRGWERLLLGRSKRRAFGELCRADERRTEICSVLDCIQDGYDIYEQADFAGFEGNELSLKCFRADALRYENVKISREQYREWMRGAKQL